MEVSLKFAIFVSVGNQWGKQFNGYQAKNVSTAEQQLLLWISYLIHWFLDDETVFTK